MKWIFLVSASVAFLDTVAQSKGGDVTNDRGKMVYEQNCLACHQSDGSGVPNLAPALIKGMFVEGEKARLIQIVLNGMEGVEIKGEYYGGPMPSFGYLSDADIADVLTYIRSNFKNTAEAITEAEVKQVRSSK